MKTFTAVSGNALDLDDDLLYIATPATGLTAYLRSEGYAPIWGYFPVANFVDGISSDGAAVFLSNDTGGAELTPRLARGNRPRLWRRVSGADIGAPYGRGVL